MISWVFYLLIDVANGNVKLLLFIWRTCIFGFLSLWSRELAYRNAGCRIWFVKRCLGKALRELWEKIDLKLSIMSLFCLKIEDLPKYKRSAIMNMNIIDSEYGAISYIRQTAFAFGFRWPRRWQTLAGGAFNYRRETFSESSQINDRDTMVSGTQPEFLLISFVLRSISKWALNEYLQVAAWGSEKAVKKTNYF